MLSFTEHSRFVDSANFHVGHVNDAFIAGLFGFVDCDCEIGWGLLRKQETVKNKLDDSIYNSTKYSKREENRS